MKNKTIVGVSTTGLLLALLTFAPFSRPNIGSWMVMAETEDQSGTTESNNPLISEKYVTDDDGNPIMGEDGYALTETEKDEEGNVIRISYYDLDRNPAMSVSKGYAEMVKEYNENGFLIKEQYLDTKGNLVVTAKGYAEIRYECDENGNAIETWYRNEEGRPTEVKGVYHIHQEYDENGNSIISFRYDANEDLVDEILTLKEYDENNHVITETFVNRNKEPVMSAAKGYSVVRKEYNDKGLVSKESYFNTDGRAVIGSDGYASIKKEYNDAKKVTYEAYFGIDGNPAYLKGGYAAVEKDYDDNGKVSTTRYLDGERNPVSRSDKGYAAWKREYDENGNVKVESYYDEAGQPTASSDGYASVVKDYNESAKVIRETYYDVDGNPVASSKGCYILAKDYNEDGRVSSERYLDAAGNPMLISFMSDPPAYSMFWICSRIFSSSALISTTTLESSRSEHFEPMVLVSRLISCMRKSSFRPTGSEACSI